jgi:sulfhydrogenase subunit beta (sulfur reductase)
MSTVKYFTISSRQLPQLLPPARALADSLIAPIRTLRGDILFSPTDGDKEVLWHYGNSLLTPVAYLYPPKEVLFEFELQEGQAPRLRYALDDQKRIIFGIRPCDTHAIAYLDKFLMGGDFVDNQYATRRMHTKIVTLACAEPASETCWCSCCEGGPIATEAFDVQLTPLGEVFLVEVAEGGQGIAEAWGDLLEPVQEGVEDLLALREAQAQRTKEAMKVNAHMAAAVRRVTAGVVPEGFWDDIGLRCAGCAGCSFVCPKCTCFNVVDELFAGGSGRRVRSKDSCRLAGYSLEASGHNPRPARSDRARRWSYHKLSYGYQQRNQYHGCVGCGRCVAVCMGGVDMPTVAKQVREVESSGTASAAG